MREALLITGLLLLGTACGEPTDEDGPDAGIVDAGPNCQPDAPIEDDPCARERDIDGVAFDCRLVAGTLTNQFLSGAQACPVSPIESCTTGELSGDLEASYRFSFLEPVPSSDPSRPELMLFRGESEVMIASGGTLEGEDVGFAEAGAESIEFTTLIDVVRGTGPFAGARGHILAKGEADLLVGSGTGTWSGEICLPR